MTEKPMSTKMQKNKLLAFMAILLFVPFLTGGIMSVNPATDEEELVLIPASKERDMGRKVDQQVHEHFDLPVDPLVQKRVEEIGRELALGADRKDVVYRFTVLNHEEDDYYNAFAAPGGYIYIFDDLVEVLETDDNIAAVLAHEMGHVEARHSVKRVQANIGITALMLLSAHMQKEEGTSAKASTAIGQLMSAYSREDERQADELSVKYMQRAGFDSKGSVNALEKLKELRKKAPRAKYSFYRSHPYLSERIAYLRKFIKGHTDFNSYINLPSREEGL
jgi:predicted Zn-dependent protease